MCKRLVAIRANDGGLMLDERECPHCGVHLTQQRIVSTLVENVLNTQAVTSARKLSGFDPAAIITTAVGALLAWQGLLPIWFRAINVVVYVMPLVLILRWFYKYWWRFRFTDEEYLESVRHMRLSLLLWLAADILNAALLLI
jgi:hypothetical protein